MKPRQGMPALKIAFGLTVPVIEAWYLAGKNHEVGEAAWVAGTASGRPPLTATQLKKLVYGTDRPSFDQATECAVKEARRIISKLHVLESAFPVGFGLMAQEIRSWKP